MLTFSQLISLLLLLGNLSILAIGFWVLKAQRRRMRRVRDEAFRLLRELREARDKAQ